MCGTCLIKTLLVILNSIVLILGIAVLALGAAGISGSKYVRKGVTLAVQNIPAISQSSGIKAEAGGDQEAIDGIVRFLQQAAIPILIVGIILTVIAICGMCGACCNSKVLLVIYVIFLIAILITQIVLIALYSAGKLDSQIKGYLKVTIQEQYVSIDSKEPISLAWTVIMLRFNCCGANNYTDFNDAKRWQRDRQVSDQTGKTVTIRLTTPIACCRMKGDFPNMEPVEPRTCAIAPNELTSNYKQGCYDNMKHEIKQYDKYVIGVVAAIITSQFLLILLTFLLMYSLDHDSKIV